jgi:hypothetical protein
LILVPPETGWKIPVPVADLNEYSKSRGKSNLM